MSLWIIGVFALLGVVLFCIARAHAYSRTPLATLGVIRDALEEPFIRVDDRTTAEPNIRLRNRHLDVSYLLDESKGQRRQVFFFVHERTGFSVRIKRRPESIRIMVNGAQVVVLDRPSRDLVRRMIERVLEAVDELPEPGLPQLVSA
ncbi:MAG: hypothetical protein U0517_02370 [Candidatus Andersenbacteria bacterium]